MGHPKVVLSLRDLYFLELSRKTVQKKCSSIQMSNRMPRVSNLVVVVLIKNDNLCLDAYSF